MNYLKLLSISMLLFGTFACSPTVPRDPRIVFEGNLGTELQIESLATSKNEAGFTILGINGINNSFSDIVLNYKIDWFIQGLPVNSILSRWDKKTIPGRTAFALKAISPNEKVNDFKIQLKRNSDFYSKNKEVE